MVCINGQGKGRERERGDGTRCVAAWDCGGAVAEGVCEEVAGYGGGGGACVAGDAGGAGLVVGCDVDCGGGREEGQEGEEEGGEGGHVG